MRISDWSSDVCSSDLASLDPHSGYLDASDYSNLRTQTDGEYGGLGPAVTMEDGVVKVSAPTGDTPADNAGIKEGGDITHIKHRTSRVEGQDQSARVDLGGRRKHTNKTSVEITMKNTQIKRII